MALRPHSIILASCKPGCKPGFRPGLQPGFRQVRAGLRHAFDLRATRFRHAHASRKPGLQPGLQLARIMECGLYCFATSLLCSAVYSDGQQTSALSCATVLYLDFVKCPRNCVMAAL